MIGWRWEVGGETILHFPGEELAQRYGRAVARSSEDKCFVPWLSWNFTLHKTHPLWLVSPGPTLYSLSGFSLPSAMVHVSVIEATPRVHCIQQEPVKFTLILFRQCDGILIPFFWKNQDLVSWYWVGCRHWSWSIDVWSEKGLRISP